MGVLQKKIRGRQGKGDEGRNKTAWRKENGGARRKERVDGWIIHVSLIYNWQTNLIILSFFTVQCWHDFNFWFSLGRGFFGYIFSLPTVLSHTVIHVIWKHTFDILAYSPCTKSIFSSHFIFYIFSHVLIFPPIRLAVLLIYFREKSRGCIESSQIFEF